MTFNDFETESTILIVTKFNETNINIYINELIKKKLVVRSILKRFNRHLTPFSSYSCTH